MKRRGKVEVSVTDNQRSYGAAMKVIGNANRQEAVRWLEPPPVYRRLITSCHATISNVLICA